MNNSPPKSALDMSPSEFRAAVDRLKFVTVNGSEQMSPDTPAAQTAKPGIESGTTASSRPTPSAVAESAGDALTMTPAEWSAALERLR